MKPHKSSVKKKGPTMKTTIELPEELWRAAKIRALDKPGGFRRVVIAALEDYLRKGKPRGRSKS